MLSWKRFQTTEFQAVVGQSLALPWATVMSSHDNPGHYMGNCIFVDAAVPPPSSEDLDAAEAIARSGHCRVVYQFIDAQQVPAPYSSAWTSTLSARGLAVETTPAWLLCYDLSELPTTVQAVHETRVLTNVDEIIASDGGASPYNADAWLRHLRLKQLALGERYGCFVASVDPATQASVGLVSLHVADGTTAVVNWCGVPEGHRRRGHARAAILRALTYARDVCQCQHVLLTAVEEGPIRLYESVGFRIIDQGNEVQGLGSLDA
ncbi:hypothetical protein ACHHYP_20101 [Achlya hypogyna]|uniref:N-acetyltransferase domain-containing protein n=1 Tax=Achlya hypogyna TaxID=1202772 RepID=A0A1V9Z6B8_ACHHY|nr:hypothetical protein ACHHYP_20101 [Achlya hypogyna]